MTDQIFRVTLHGPFGATTGYGLSEAEARRYAERAIKAQKARIRVAKLKFIRRYTLLTGILTQVDKVDF